jgi:hypothetical protein
MYNAFLISSGVNSLKRNEKAKDASKRQETVHKLGIYGKCKQVIACEEKENMKLWWMWCCGDVQGGFGGDVWYLVKLAIS